MSPVFVRALMVAEQKELSQLIRRDRDARIVRRAQMIRLSADGMTPPQIAAMWDINDQTVRRTIQRFEAEGIVGLRDKPRKGRPPKKTDRYVALLKEAVDANPRDMGYPFSCWMWSDCGSTWPDRRASSCTRTTSHRSWRTTTSFTAVPSMAWLIFEIPSNTRRRRRSWSL